MKKKLSKQQLEVMSIPWNSDVPLIASDIATYYADLNINTVQTCLKVLIKSKVVEVADIVYSGTVLTRSYRPLISKDEYFDGTYNKIIGDITHFSLIASFVESKTNFEELNSLEEMIKEKRTEVEDK